MHPDFASLFVDGVLLRREALEWGIDDEHLTRAVHQEILIRVRQGVYADRSSWDRATSRERFHLLKAGVLRMYGGGRLSHDSGVIVHDGPDWRIDLEHLHLSSPDGNGRKQARIVHHRGDPHPSDVLLPGGGSVTSVARTVVETTIQSGSVELGIVLASLFLHEGQTTSDELRDAHGTVRQNRGALLLTPALGLADARLESVLESRCWYMFHRYGLRGVVPQYPVTVKGHDFNLDFLIEDLGVWVETDGKEKYLKYRRPGESVADAVLRERRREVMIREQERIEPVRVNWWDSCHPEATMQRIFRAASRRRAA